MRLMPYANNKGGDQPAHLRSLMSPFIVRCLDSIIPIRAIAKVSRLYLATVAEWAGLSLIWSQTSFLMTWLIYYTFVCSSAITKAVETAINSRQWAKAVQILELQDSALASRYYKKIADHYASIGEYEVRYLSRLTTKLIE